MRYLGRTHRVSVARMHEIFKMPDIHLIYESTHRQSADIYTKGFTEPLKWYAACLLVNVVDGTKLKQLLTNFTIHKYEKEQEDILALYPDPLRKKATPHDLYDYVAAPSVQRRGGTTNVIIPKTDARIDKNHAPDGSLLRSRAAGGRDNDDICGDLTTFDDVPLYIEGDKDDKDKTADQALDTPGLIGTTGQQDATSSGPTLVHSFAVVPGGVHNRRRRHPKAVSS